MPEVYENWKCPHCGHAQAITAPRYDAHSRKLDVEGWERGRAAYRTESIVCANAECRQLTFTLGLGELEGWNDGQPVISEFVGCWQLLPASSAKPQPDYIPEALRGDYEEACAIRDASPKASATITRRCIQGIIRDFCGINKRRLIDEINELRRVVDAGQAPPGVQADTVDAIDHVRQIGNIGAHMEADINLMIDVDPDQAQVLIELTELLLDEWYVASEERRRRLAKLGVIAVDKKQLQQQKRLPAPNMAQVDATASGCC
jgi:hypothetical protein